MGRDQVGSMPKQRLKQRETFRYYSTNAICLFYLYAANFIVALHWSYFFNFRYLLKVFGEIIELAVSLLSMMLPFSMETAMVKS